MPRVRGGSGSGDGGHGGGSSESFAQHIKHKMYSGGVPQPPSTAYYTSGSAG